jgi:integral membrane sensor domain MASE1
VDSRRFRTALAAAALCAVYFVAGKLSLQLAFLHASASPVWPPSGIALGALVLFGMRLWPAIFLGAFLVNLTTEGNLLTSFAIAGGNTLEGVVGAWLIQRFANASSVFNRAHDVARFAVAVALSTVISPGIGLTALALNGFATWAQYPAIWLTWWLGDFGGIVIFAPLVILWLGCPLRRVNPARDFEVAILLLLLALLSEVVFRGWLAISTLNYPSAFILGPVVVWTSFRLSARETATGLFALSAIAIWGTLQRYGPFVRQNPNGSLLILQAFNILTTITALALAAGMSERRRAEAAIEQQRATVEAANRTKDNFLAMLSHELRTPLTPVLAALDALRSDPQRSPDMDATLFHDAPQHRARKPAHRRSPRSHPHHER